MLKQSSIGVYPMPSFGVQPIFSKLHGVTVRATDEIDATRQMRLLGTMPTNDDFDAAAILTYRNSRFGRVYGQ